MFPGSRELVLPSERICLDWSGSGGDDCIGFVFVEIIFFVHQVALVIFVVRVTDFRGTPFSKFLCFLDPMRITDNRRVAVNFIVQ